MKYIHFLLIRMLPSEPPILKFYFEYVPSSAVTIIYFVFIGVIVVVESLRNCMGYMVILMCGIVVGLCQGLLVGLRVERGGIPPRGGSTQGEETRGTGHPGTLPPGTPHLPGNPFH
jgi:hypothetical protein